MVHIEAECAFGPDQGDCDNTYEGFHVGLQASEDTTTIGWFDGGDHFGFRRVDLTGVNSMVAMFASQNSGRIQVRIDSLTGAIIAERDMVTTGSWTTFAPQRIPLTPTTGVHDLYIIGMGGTAGIGNFDWLELDVCTPQCTGKDCGDDMCGGICGTCTQAGYECTAAQVCAPCVPICTNKSCGDDTCGGSCGTCGDGQVCVADRTCQPIADLGAPPRIHADGRVLKNPDGDEVILHGVSLIDMSSQWGWRNGKIPAAIDRLTADGWKTEIVRFPVYTTGSYPMPFSLTDRMRRENYMNQILRPAVDYATQKGLYVIIDFHQISDVTEAMDQAAMQFWGYMAGQFANYPNVIYELFNEPIDMDHECQAGTTDRCWPPYKAKVERWIEVVRQAAPDTLLLVGGPYWSQIIGPAATDPVSDPNVAYVGHIYPEHIEAGGVAAQIIRAASARPVILTEWGYEGEDPTYVEAMRTLIQENGLSWTAWCADYDWWPPMYTTTYELTPFGQTVQDWLALPLP